MSTLIVDEGHRLVRLGVGSSEPDDPENRWAAFCLHMMTRLEAVKTEEGLQSLIYMWTMYLGKPDRPKTP